MPCADPTKMDQDLYRHMVEGVDDLAIILVDADGRILTWNRGAERITGYAAREMVGEPAARLLCPDGLEPTSAGLVADTTPDGSRRTVEGWRIRKNGARFWVSVATSPVTGDDGRLIGLCHVIRDATDRKCAEDALARATAEMEQLASIVSHDLRSPLLAISGCAQLLREQFAEVLGEEGHELLGMVQDGVSRMGLMIRDLLAYARATPARARRETVDAEQVLVEALAGLPSSIPESGAVVTHDPLPTVRANATQLGQVFAHLVGNALKFRRDEPPKVHVSVCDHGDQWKFSVRDNGIGIDAAQFEKIFGVFCRLHEEGKYGGGTGIGLAICKKIVEYHGGRIWVESRPGQGSMFCFTLPKPA